MVFPTGAPGAGLMLLRISTAAALAAGVPTLIPTFLDFGVATLMVALAVGAFTRAAAVLSACMAMFVCLDAGGKPALVSALLSLPALALALLGPGGYSVDALLFGRRVIRLDD